MRQSCRVCVETVLFVYFPILYVCIYIYDLYGSGALPSLILDLELLKKVWEALS